MNILCFCFIFSFFYPGNTISIFIFCQVDQYFLWLIVWKALSLSIWCLTGPGPKLVRTMLFFWWEEQSWGLKSEILVDLSWISISSLKDRTRILSVHFLLAGGSDLILESPKSSFGWCRKIWLLTKHENGWLLFARLYNISMTKE